MYTNFVTLQSKCKVYWQFDRMSICKLLEKNVFRIQAKLTGALWDQTIS